MTKRLRMRWAAGMASVVLSVASPNLLSAGSQSAARDNIVVVLDASGSMRETMSGQSASRMQIAQQALTEVLKTLPADAHIGLLVFSGADADGRALREHWVYPLGPLDIARLSAAIQIPRPEGNTPLGKYMKIGADELLKQRVAQRGVGTFRLLVVSDGEANDLNLLKRYLPDLMTRGILVDVIGVDMKTDHALATQVHSYRRANDPVALRQAVAAALAELGTVRDAGADSEAYAAVAALPDSLVTDVLKSLSAVRDYPIGEAPPVVATPVADPVAASPAPNPGGTAKTAPPLAESPVAGGNSNRGISRWVWFGIGLFVILLLRRGRRRSPRGH